MNKRTYFQNTVFIFVLSMFCGVIPPASSSDQAAVPFTPGEKLTFQLKWEFIPAGEAVLQVFPTTRIDGIPSYQFVLQARSNSFFDLFYKVRDRIESYSDLEMTRSLRYTKQQLEGRTKRDIVVRFDWEHGTAQYSNFGKLQDPIPLMPGTFDPLSVFYYSRCLDLKTGETLQRPVTDGKKNIMANASIVKKETLTLPFGTVTAYLIEPELKDIRGVFEKSKDANIQVWVTADQQKIPVKIKSRVAVGSFTGELISMETVADEP